MSAHTPGPWGAKTRNIYGGGGRIVAQAHWPVVPGLVTSEEPSAEELAANIALLAAAPDLLEALQRIISAAEVVLVDARVTNAEGLDAMNGISDALEQARAAIAKATDK